MILNEVKYTNQEDKQMAIEIIIQDEHRDQMEKVTLAESNAKA